MVWALIGVFINATIGVLATPARETARAAARLAGDFTDAADQAAKVPGVGEQLRRPFDAASVTMGNLIVSANHQVDSIERLALIVGWLVFLIPVAVVVAFWLPRRIRFYRQARASQQFIDSAADLDLFALRAMASQPLYVLAGVSDDPVRDWRDGESGRDQPAGRDRTPSQRAPGAGDRRSRRHRRRSQLTRGASSRALASGHSSLIIAYCTVSRQLPSGRIR